MYELQKQAEQRALGELFMPVSQRVQMNFIFNDNIRILCLSGNVKKVGKLVRFKQKGQKQALFLAFHKCCQGCLLRGPRYISTSFILVCVLRCTQLQGTRKVYSQAEKFIRLVRIKQKFIRIAYLYSKCTDCRIITVINYVQSQNTGKQNNVYVFRSKKQGLRNIDKIDLWLRELNLCVYDNDVIYVYVLQIVVCPFSPFLLTTVLSVLLRFTDSNYPFGIFKLFQKLLIKKNIYLRFI